LAIDHDPGFACGYAELALVYFAAALPGLTTRCDIQGNRGKRPTGLEVGSRLAHAHAMLAAHYLSFSRLELV